MARGTLIARGRPGAWSRAVLALLVLAAVLPARAEEPAADRDPPRYATSPRMEPDRCATAWVIVRYVHPDAVFEFHPRDTMPSYVILYDLPEATLKRDARRATVEVLVEREGVTDPFVHELAAAIHDIEINAWGGRRVPWSRDLEAVLKRAFQEAGGPEEALDACFRLLDGLREHAGDPADWVSSVAPSP